MDANEERLTGQMLQAFGPTMCGPVLYRALGYATYAAFRRSRALGELGVHVFKLPARKGVCALTTDVATWLAVAAAKPSAQAIANVTTKDP